MYILNPYVLHLYVGLLRSWMHKHDYICNSGTVYGCDLIYVLSEFGNWQISFYISYIEKSVLPLMTVKF